MLRLIAKVTTILFVLTFWASSMNVSAENATAGSRKPAPGFSLNDDKGAVVQLSNYKGKVVLLNFWATWCHGCKEEIPWYMEFADKYKSQGLVVIGASMDDDGWKSVKPFLQEKKLNYPVVIGDQKLSDAYGVDSMPVSVLIDREGMVADSHQGVIEKDGWEREIQQLLKEPATPATK